MGAAVSPLYDPHKHKQHKRKRGEVLIPCIQSSMCGLVSSRAQWQGFARNFSPPSQGLESASLNKTCNPPFPFMFSSLSNQWLCLVARHLGDLIAEIISNIHTNLHPQLKHITIQEKNDILPSITHQIPHQIKDPRLPKRRSSHSTSHKLGGYTHVGS